MWDPAQYSRFSDERSRPFFELLARVRHLQPSRIADLGCGTGSLTAVLSDLWPEADILGIDRSEEMLALASEINRPNVRFEQKDISEFTANGHDLILSNAALHWINNHETVILRLGKALEPGGTIAFQVPANFDAPSHLLLRKLCVSREWQTLLGDPKRQSYSRSAVEYARTLLNHGFKVDAWETTYVQLLPGEDAVYEWMAGTTLRPVFAILNDRQEERFSEELKEMLRSAYPMTAYGTVYEFRRVFVVAQAPGAPSEMRRDRAVASEPMAVRQ